MTNSQSTTSRSGEILGGLLFRGDRFLYYGVLHGCPDSVLGRVTSGRKPFVPARNSRLRIDIAVSYPIQQPTFPMQKRAPNAVSKLPSRKLCVLLLGSLLSLMKARPLSRWAIVLAVSLSLNLIPARILADDPPPTPEDLERMAAIEAFTKKQQEAKYGEKFEAAAKEFGIPVEILMGISFAETRMEHLTWPEGETVSPENGMPRPYGIMSLWDNDFFGHTLTEAAKLIGKDPEQLKKDPLDNIRGAAALLKKMYAETEKPEYANTEDKLESWKYTIRKYSGIPEIDLADNHATDVYDFLAEGYDQYGIKLPEVPNLDLKSLHDENKKIREEQRQKNEAKWRAEGKMDDAILEEYTGPDGLSYARVKGSDAQETGSTAKTAKPAQKPEVTPVVAVAPANNQNWIFGLVAIGLCAVALAFLIFRKKPTVNQK